jgi:hypothetical protein
MDPLSVIASVIAILQLANDVVKYLSEAKDAPEECQNCLIEVSNLLGPLITLRYRAEQAQSGDPSFEQLRRLNVQDGPLDQYKQALEVLRSKADMTLGVHRLKTRLVWKFSKDEVATILARVERVKTLVTIALEMDHR